MSQTQFHYTKPSIDTEYCISSCRDVATTDITPLADNEIVVFGDSFSSEDDYKWPDSRWHQFMGAAIKKTIVMTGDFLRPVESYLSLLTYHPELLSDTVIVETIERELINRFCWLDFQNIPEEKPTFDASNKESLLDKWNKNKRLPVQYYQRRLGIDVPVLTAKLDTPLFSCRPNKLFYYANDTITRSEWEIETAIANLQRLDSLSRAHGKTLVVVAIPNKLTVYHNHIIGDNTARQLLESPCPFDTLPCFINTLPVLDSLIENGIKDVYLPDDSHFSIPTSKAIGEYVAKRLNSRP